MDSGHTNTPTHLKSIASNPASLLAWDLAPVSLLSWDTGLLEICQDKSPHFLCVFQFCISVTCLESGQALLKLGTVAV
jgi:hypothetical protein